MTTCRDIITDAFQLAGIVPIGDTPTASEASFALIGLQSMFQSWAGNNLFGALKEVFVTEDYVALENERITIDDATVTIPITYEKDGDGYRDGAGERRAPRELSCIVTITNSAVFTYIYDRRQWVQVETLTLDSECPLAQYGARGLAACLAVEAINTPAYGGQVTPGMMRSCTAFKGAVMRARLVSSRRTDGPLYY